MANKKSDFEFTAGVVADVSSAEKATKDLTKGMLSSLKDGYIEIPAEVKVPIKGASKELKQAQEKVLAQWEKTFNKGFSSSVEDLKELRTAYNKFKKESKGTKGDAQTKWIKDVIGKQVESYKNDLNIALKQIKELKKSERRNPDFGVQKGEIDAQIKKRLVKTYKNIKSVTPKGYRTDTGVDLGKANEHSFRLSEVSPYPSKWATIMARHKKEEDEKIKTTIWNDKTYEPKNKGALSRATTDREFNDDIAKKALNELKEMVIAIEKGAEDITPEIITEQLGVVKTAFERNRKDLEETSIALKNALEKPYSDTVKKQLGGTNGGEKGVGPGHVLAKETQRMVYDLWGKIIESSNPTAIYARRFATEIKEADITAKSKRNSTKKSITSKYEVTKNELKNSEDYKAFQDLIKSAAIDSKRTIKKATTISPYKETENKFEDIKEVFDTKLKDAMCPCQEILKSINENVSLILQKLIKPGAQISKSFESLAKPIAQLSKNTTSLVAVSKPQAKQKKAEITDKTDYKELARKKQLQEFEAQRQADIMQNIENRQNKMKLSSAQLSPFQYDTFSKILQGIKKALDIRPVRRNARDISRMTQEQQEKLRAERIARFGLARGTNDTGDLGRVFRTRSLFGWGKKRNIQNPFEDLKLSESFNIDTTEITESLQNAIQKNMFKAQTGGGILRNIFGSMTGYIGMPSLEKSRAEADAANQLMAEVRRTMQDMLNDISSKETDLRGLKARGDAVFNADGTLDMSKSSNAAITLFGQLEEKKMALRGVLADVAEIDTVVKQTNGNLTKIFKKLGFVSPELRKTNNIIENINAGLDKNGKALKFQTRTAEVLNYTFQYMARRVGQMIKNWISMLNPINLIKRAFQDFASYDVKWQRTMNVIKYNLRRIVRPMMEWIAQQLVNIIGLVNALIKGLGKAFGKDWDLFDKSAASAEQMREELEQAANITASFDELHDIGTESSSNPALDLTGDIYTPQWTDLYSKIENFGEKIGNIFDKIKGGFEKIKSLTEGWDFWDWLKLIGAALVGFLALKFLIELFTGKNPLKSVADGFSFLEKAVGWALLIWAFTEFTKALTDFVECMKSASWEDIAKALLTLAGAFAGLVLAAGGLMYISTALGILAPALAGLAAVVGAFTLFIYALTNFIECMKSASWEDIIKSLLMLAGAFAILVLGAGGLMFIASALGALLPQLLGLAAVVATLSLFTAALALFAEAIKGLTENDVINGLKLLGGALLELVVAVGALAIVASLIPPQADLALAAIALVIGAVAGLVLALSEFIKALHDNGEDVKLFLEGVKEVILAFGDAFAKVIETIGKIIIGVIDSFGTTVVKLVETIGDTIERIVEIVGTTVTNIIETVLNGIANIFKTVLQPILDFINDIITKILELAETIVREVGSTIRDIIEKVGKVVLGIIDKLINAIPKLLNSIVSFVGRIGSSIESLANSIMRIVTKIINFIVSAIEFLVNLVIDGINGIISAINSVGEYVNITIPKVPTVKIRRFVPQYEKGTNYVPNDGLAYLHKGEAVIPKKYNQQFVVDNSGLEDAMYNLIKQVNQISQKVDQGIDVNGQFVQKGSDLVAVVQKVSNKNSNTILNNKVYAR